MRQALEMALEALEFALHVGFPESSESQIKKGEKAYQQHRAAITAIKEALAQPEQWGASAVTHPEYIDEQKAKTQELRSMLAQPEQPKVRTGDCLLTGFCASEGHKIQKAEPEQEPVAWKPIETAPKDAMVLVCLPRQMNLVVRAWYNSIHNFWQTDYEGEGGITRPIYFHEGDLWHPIPPLYTTPPQRKPLTDEQLMDIYIHTSGLEFYKYFARAIEAAHGIKE